MGYRETFFAHHKGTKLPFKRGVWYQCVFCKKWFRKADITVDHIIPKRKGGTDQLANLQAACRSCNSSKRERQSGFETVKSLAGSAVHGGLGEALGSMAKQGVKDALHIKYKRK